MVQDSSEGVTRIRRCRFEMKTPDKYAIKRLYNLNHTYLIFGYIEYKTSEYKPDSYKSIEGYMEFSKPVTQASLKVELPNATLSATAWSSKRNIELIKSKYPEDCIVEEGKSRKQGIRDDGSKLIELIKEGKPMREVALPKYLNSFNVRYLNLYYTLYEPPYEGKKTVYWLYGETGVGKTASAEARLRSLYGDKDFYHKTAVSGKWWQGYDSCKAVLIDDYRPNIKGLGFNELLALLDAYTTDVEYKGGSRRFKAETIVITSPRHPRQTFKGVKHEDIEQ